MNFVAYEMGKEKKEKKKEEKKERPKGRKKERKKGINRAKKDMFSRKNERKKNQLPQDKRWSSVPLPCLLICQQQQQQ